MGRSRTTDVRQGALYSNLQARDRGADSCELSCLHCVREQTDPTAKPSSDVGWCEQRGTSSLLRAGGLIFETGICGLKLVGWTSECHPLLPWGPADV